MTAEELIRAHIASGGADVACFACARRGNKRQAGRIRIELIEADGDRETYHAECSNPRCLLDRKVVVEHHGIRRISAHYLVRKEPRNRTPNPA